MPPDSTEETSRGKKPSSVNEDDDILERQQKIIEKVCMKALRYQKQFDNKTAFYLKDIHSNNNVKKLEWRDLRIGELIGEGGFSNINEVTMHPISRGTDGNVSSAPLNHDSTQVKCTRSSSSLSSASLSYHSDSDDYDNKEPETYVLKHLKPSILSDALDRSSSKGAKRFSSGLVDLVLEGRMLSVLNHENIIKIHAMPSFCVSESYAQGDANGYFLVLDKLVGDVAGRMSQWQVEDNKARTRSIRPMLINGRPSLNMSGGTGSKSEHRQLLLRRINDVVLPVANALEYLHSKDIVFRDLKPKNVGFDANGNIKLFDFGLARKVRPDNERKMTGNTGTLRYMAPEVARRDRYGLKADVYSFGVFFWEVLTTKKPFDFMDREMFMEHVVYGDFRPNISRKCGSSRIRSLIEMCWDDIPNDRPTFKSVCNILQKEVAKIPSTDRTGQERATRNTSNEMVSKVSFEQALQDKLQGKATLNNPRPLQVLPEKIHTPSAA